MTIMDKFYGLYSCSGAIATLMREGLTFFVKGSRGDDGGYNGALGDVCGHMGTCRAYKLYVSYLIASLHGIE